MTGCIYLDYAATTPIDRTVCHAMTSLLESEYFANPSSSHNLGKLAKKIIEENREAVAHLIGADSSEIIWTSGATESNNLAIIGSSLAKKHIGNHIITLSTEHESVLKPCQYLETHGFEVTYLNPEPNGLLNIEKLEQAITKNTILITIMMVNNESGVVQNIPQIAELAKKRGILFHVDGAQAVGKLKIDVKEMGIDLLSISAHKVYGPKGIGALYINQDRKVDLIPLLYGGAQERGMRPGTLATHQIVGLGVACRVAAQEMEVNYNHAIKIRDYFVSQMGDDIKLNISKKDSSPYIISTQFINLNEYKRNRINLLNLVVISSRSACSSYKKSDVSHVLKAMAMSLEDINNTYRISIGKYTTQSHIMAATETIKRILKV